MVFSPTLANTVAGAAAWCDACCAAAGAACAHAAMHAAAMAARSGACRMRRARVAGWESMVMERFLTTEKKGASRPLAAISAPRGGALGAAYLMWQDRQT